MAINKTLSAFRNAVRDVARPNRFYLYFHTPPIFPNAGQWEFGDDMQYHIKAASLPGRTIGEIGNVFWQGLNFKMTGDPVYEDYTVTFMNNVDFKARKLIETWMSNIADPVENTRSDQTSYKSCIKIVQLDNLIQPIEKGTYFLDGVFPMSIDPIELSHESSDTIEEFSVTFSVDHWGRTDPSTWE